MVTASTFTVLDYAPRRRSLVKDVVRGLARACIVLFASGLIGALLVWLFVPVVYVDRFLVYDRTLGTSTQLTSRGAALATIALQLESPAAVQTAVAPLIAQGTVSSNDVKQAVIHAEVDRRSDVISVNVQHPDPKVAEVISSALVAGRSAASTNLIVLQLPVPAAQLGPVYTTASWMVFSVCAALPTFCLLLLFRKYIFTMPAHES